ncbi:hypothetical protein BC835DRAFT_1383010 [Cytidiella melzeri]|nr:hypothetical protein BC835DRAFT_1383010 [Cytidiella melzeri]
MHFLPSLVLFAAVTSTSYSVTVSATPHGSHETFHESTPSGHYNHLQERGFWRKMFGVPPSSGYQKIESNAPPEYGPPVSKIEAPDLQAAKEAAARLRKQGISQENYGKLFRQTYDEATKGHIYQGESPFLKDVSVLVAYFRSHYPRENQVDGQSYMYWSMMMGASPCLNDKGEIYLVNWGKKVV